MFCYNAVMLKKIIILAIPLALAGCKSGSIALDVLGGHGGVDHQGVNFSQLVDCRGGVRMRLF
jgi:hypothetical protein